MGVFRRALHRIAHWFGWNSGTVETWVDGRIIMVGFRCGTCGEISEAHPGMGLAE